MPANVAYILKSCTNWKIIFQRWYIEKFVSPNVSIEILNVEIRLNIQPYHQAPKTLATSYEELTHWKRL